MTSLKRLIFQLILVMLPFQMVVASDVDAIAEALMEELGELPDGLSWHETPYSYEDGLAMRVVLFSKPNFDSSGKKLAFQTGKYNSFGYACLYNRERFDPQFATRSFLMAGIGGFFFYKGTCGGELVYAKIHPSDFGMGKKNVRNFDFHSIKFCPGIVFLADNNYEDYTAQMNFCESRDTVHILPGRWSECKKVQSDSLTQFEDARAMHFDPLIKQVRIYYENERCIGNSKKFTYSSSNKGKFLIERDLARKMKSIQVYFRK